MTAATTTTLDTPQRDPSTLVRRLARATGAVLAIVGARWNDIVDSGQLGPSPDSALSRHTGSRI